MNHVGTSQFQLMTTPGVSLQNQALQFQHQQQLQFNPQQQQQFQPNQQGMIPGQQNSVQIPDSSTSLVFQARSYFNSSERKAEIEQASTAGQQFYKLYYDTLQKRRHIITKLYLDNAVIIWNGHGVASMPQIQKLFEELPVGTYSVYSVDSQPVAEETGAVKTIVVTVAGVWRLPEQAPCPFQQTFVITAQEDKWKIASDVFRTQEVETS